MTVEIIDNTSAPVETNAIVNSGNTRSMIRAWDNIEESSESTEEVEEPEENEDIEEPEEEEGDEETDEETEDTSDADEEDKSEEDSEDTEPKKEKIYRAKTPEGEGVKVNGDTKIKIPLNGKFKWVTVKDLTSKYNGEVVYEERFEELNARERALEAKERDKSQTSVKSKELVENMLHSFQKDDFTNAMLTISELTGQEPTTFSTNLINGMHKMLVHLGSMSEEGRQAWQANLELQAIKKKTERDGEASKKKEYISEQNKALTEYRAAFGFTQAELQSAAKNLLEDQKVDKSQVTAEVLAITALNERIYTNIDSVAEDLGATLDKHARDYVARIVQDKAVGELRDLSIDEYEEIIQTHVLRANKEKAEENLSRKVQETRATPKRSNKKKVETPLKGVRLEDKWGSL